MRLTPPLLAKRRIAGFVIPWMLSLSTFLCLLAPPFPNPLPPFPLPDIVEILNQLNYGFIKFYLI